jgi:hypothetical protein
MLSTMRAHFMHELENKMLSVSGFSKLNAAIGIALDINNDQMEGSVADKMAEASSETSTSASVTTWQRLKPEEWSSPVDACVNSILDFCDTGEAFVKHPSAFFQHRLLCAEMLLTLIDQLKQLGDVDMAGLGPDFGPNLIAANTRAKVKLASMQAAAPNTFQAVHTLVAFKVVAAEFHHRVHMYQDQGFFTDILVAGANFAMEEREHELAQYFNVDPLMTAIGLCSGFVLMKDHPVVFLYGKDKDGQNLPKTAETENPSAETDPTDPEADKT